MQDISNYHLIHASFSFHQSNLQVAYTTQAWILNLKTCAIQANIWNEHSNASIKFMSLLSLLVSSNFNWYPYFHISSPMSKFSPSSYLWACSPYLCAQILIDPLTFIFLPLCQSSPPLSSFPYLYALLLSLCHQRPQRFNFK